MELLVQWYPKKAAALIKYLDIIHQTLRGFGGQAWLLYDENFRLRASHDPLLSWTVPHFELWVQIVMPSRPVMDDGSDSGHFISRNDATNPRVVVGTQGVQLP